MKNLGIYSGKLIENHPVKFDIASAIYFLDYGYFPPSNSKFSNQLWSSGLSNNANPKDILSEICARVSNWDEICVPLSGGIDSRILLSFALEHYESKKISTITYGTPGSWDFEIPKKIVKDFNLRSLFVDLTHVNYDQSFLNQRVKGVNARTNLFHMPQPDLVDDFIEDRLVWSGIFGDVVAGSAAPKERINDFDRAVNSYLIGKRVVLSPAGKDHNFQHFFDKSTLPDKFNLDYSEALLFFHRLPSYYMPNIFFGNSSFFAPFLCEELIDAILGNNLSQKSRMMEYKKIIDYSNKQTGLFNYPLKNFDGVGIYSNTIKKISSKYTNKVLRKFFKSSKHLNFTNWNAKSEKESLQQEFLIQKDYISTKFPKLFEALEQGNYFRNIHNDFEAMGNLISLALIYRHSSQ